MKDKGEEFYESRSTAINSDDAGAARQNTQSKRTRRCLINIISAEINNCRERSQPFLWRCKDGVDELATA